MSHARVETDQWRWNVTNPDAVIEDAFELLDLDMEYGMVAQRLGYHRDALSKLIDRHGGRPGWRAQYRIGQDG